MKNEVMQGREIRDLEFKDFKNVITPIYRDGAKEVQSMSVPTYVCSDKCWSVSNPSIDRIAEGIEDYGDIVKKQIIMTETFKTRFYTLMKTNVESLFASYSNMMVNDKRLLDLNNEIGKVDFYPASTFSRNLDKVLEDESGKNDFIKELLYNFRPANISNIFYNRRDNTDLYDCEVYRNAFEITTYFTADRSIVFDYTNLFATFFMTTVLESMKLVINEKEIYDILNSYIVKLSSDLFDILSMIFITMYETAQEYLKYTSYLCHTADDKELMIEMDEEYSKAQAEAMEENNDTDNDKIVDSLNSIINAATAKLQALKNNK